MKTVKHQHYVPRFYLKRFTVDGERLYVYDKAKDEVRGPESVKRVAQERFFYDLPIETLPPDADPQLEEKALSQLESMFSEAIESAFRVIEGKGATLQERMNMSLFVTFQIMRTRAQRNALVEVVTDVQEELMNTLLRIMQPAWAERIKAKVHYDEGAAATLHARTMWDMDTITKLALGIYHHLWFIGVNNTDEPLYTSDNPVVMRSHANDEEPNLANDTHRPGLTLALIEARSTRPTALSKGVEMIFPLSPKTALFMVDEEHFVEHAPNQGRVFTMRKEIVRICNTLQAQQSERQIFSFKRDFELAELICKQENTNKKRHEINTAIHVQFD